MCVCVRFPISNEMGGMAMEIEMEMRPEMEMVMVVMMGRRCEKYLSRDWI